MGVLKRLGVLVDTWNGPRQMKQFAAGWPAKTSDDIKFYRTPLAQYRYREQGPGTQTTDAPAPTIVFSADPPVTLEAYDRLMQVFSQHFRVIVFEMPAMGFSAPSRRYKFGFQETCDDLAVFLRHVAGHRSILAFSCGIGLAAIDIAARFPDLVGRLVVMQTTNVEGFDRWKKARDPKNILAKPILGQLAMRKVAAKRMPDWFELAVGREQTYEHCCQCTAPAMAHGSQWALASSYQNTLLPDIKLGVPKQPILALWGALDGSHPEENAAGAKSFSNNVRFERFDDLGHFSELEDPERVFGLIREFTG